MTTNFSVISSNFSEDREMYIGYLEASEGMGLMIGPALGSVMYGVLGYDWAFYAFSIMIVMTFFVQLIFLPSSLNSEDDDETEQIN
jgi:MFS family permease